MNKTISIILSGEAGQGLMTIESLLAMAIREKYYLFTSPEFMSRVRGGNNSIELVLSFEPIAAWRKKTDVLIILGKNSFERMKPRLKDDSLIISERSLLTDSEWSEFSPTEFNMTELAKNAGSLLYMNTVIFGYMAKLLKLGKASCVKAIKTRFKKLSDDIIQKNISAFESGYKACSGVELPFNIPTVEEKPKKIIMNGSTAVGLGALAGGVNFLASYPMSPSTGVMIYLAGKGKQFDVLVEQAEDEIAALNMVIGAWYAGARAMATTSGGGFALMCEALSLAGITETPCVIHLAMRPGPATGLPTRTEQGDVNLAVYAGHGDFPRILLTPGHMADAAILTQRAFYLADKYQVPVIVLTDQYLLDSMAETDPFEFDGDSLESFIVESKPGYKRYDLSSGPISPRAIPGFGKGFVKADSDEHTEEGLITEDFDIRVAMNDKRMAKIPLLLEDYQEPVLYGDADYNRLFVGFGSTHGVLKEFVENSNEKDAFLYVRQVYPLPETLKAYFDKAGEIITVENNATGQFAGLLHSQLSIKADRQIKKYNGEPFSIEDIEAEAGKGL